MKRAVFFLIVFFIFSAVGYIMPVAATLDQPSREVYLIEISGAIDLGLSSFIRRALEEAKEGNAAAVILEIDTFGGRVDAVLDICKYLEDVKPLETVAFIKGNAWSAGALIALASQKIIMAPGSTIGSAEPKAMGFGAQDASSDEKTVSAIRAKFKSIAETNGYPVNLALAMVDKDFEIKLVEVRGMRKVLTAEEVEEAKEQHAKGQVQVVRTINAKGKLLNLTASEAKEIGLASAIIENRKELLAYLGLSGKETNSPELTWSENLVRVITHPLISPLLLSLGFLGLLFEMRIPGWGLSGTLGVVFLGLFFWGHYLAGLANWTELVIFAAGALLILLEIFLIPGFGVAGILGIIFIFAGIFLALLKFPLRLPQLELARAFATLGYAVIFTFLAGIIGFKFLPKSAFFRKLILTSEEKKEEGFISAASLEKYLGKEGKAITPLKPCGKADIGGDTVDVTSEGGFIEKGSRVIVAGICEGRVVVKEV